MIGWLLTLGFIVATKPIWWGLFLKQSKYTRMLGDFILLKFRDRLIKYFHLGEIKSLGKKYSVTYFDGEQRYTIFFPKNRRVRQIKEIYDVEGTNVTDRFFEILGPGKNFHGIPSTPELIGWPRGIKVEYRSGKEREYLPSEVILLSM